jgi:hypothetical protein
MRAILTSAYGVKADISMLVETVIEHGEYEDFRDAAVNRYVVDLGRKLVLVGGQMATMVVYVAVEQHLSPDYAAHLAQVWGLNDLDDSDIDEDDVPSISLSGSPPAGRLRSAAG